jgi:hypothetical protein
MPLLTGSRALWLPGMAVLAASAVIAGLLGFAVGARTWAPYLAFTLGTLIALGALERIIDHRRTPPPTRPRGAKAAKVPRAGNAEYDLAKDDRTDHQRYLM